MKKEWPVAVYSYVIFGAKLTFTISLSDSNKQEFYNMSMMLVDAGSSSKKRKRGSASGPSSGIPVRVVGPKMRGGQFSSGGRGARNYGARSVVEPGFVDLAKATYAYDTTGSITLLNTVAQGAGTSQRVGKKIQLKSLQFHGTSVNGSTATDNDVSFLIVYDKRPVGTLPAITDVLNTVSSHSFNNDGNSDRFMILKRVDKALVGSAANQYTSKFAESEDFFLNLRGLPQVFKAAGTGAIGDISEGCLYLITVGSGGAGTTAASITGGFRTRYIDV